MIHSYNSADILVSEEKLIDPAVIIETHWHEIYSQFINDCILAVYNNPSIIIQDYCHDEAIYNQFISENIQLVYDSTGRRDETVRTTLTEIYVQFKIWFRANFPEIWPPERTIVRTEITSRLGRLQGNSWCGVQLIDNMGLLDRID